jgi:hypothetical protein
LEDSSSRLAQASSSQGSLSKITRAKWTSRRVPALQVQSPEFKPQSHSKRKKKLMGKFHILETFLVALA